MTLKELKDLIEYCKKQKVLILKHDGSEITLSTLAFVEAGAKPNKSQNAKTTLKPDGDDELLYASA